jgi:hypothetical protein
MYTLIREFDVVKRHFTPRCLSYDSFIVAHKTTGEEFLLTRYNLGMIRMPLNLLQSRLLFLCRHYKLFRCESVFFHHHLTSLDGPLDLISPFYILERLPMTPLADYASSHKVTRSLLFEKLPHVLNTLSSLHSLDFPYLNLSPFSIIVEDTFLLRPPPLNPFDFPSSMLPPAPGTIGDVDATRLYQSPEWNCVELFCSSDCWSLATILAELLVIGTPLFASRDRREQIQRTQVVLGRAPSFVEWPRPACANRCGPLPDLLVQLLDYDPERRPNMCVHVAQRVLALVQEPRAGSDVRRNGRSFAAQRRDQRERVLQDSSDEDGPVRVQATGRWTARPDRWRSEGGCVGCAVARRNRNLGRQRGAFRRPHY